MEKALVILSGGQDSTTCLFWALNRFDHVEAITFIYGQRHAIEVNCAGDICESQDIPHKIIYLGFMAQLSDSALIDHTAPIEDNEETGLPSTYVPNRNQLFITLAHAYAQKRGINHLITGVCQTDYSGYPDCREIFINAISVASNLGSEKEIVIHTPLMYMTKAEIWELAEVEGCLSVILAETMTCYNGKSDISNAWGYGCAECPACKLRRAGWDEYIKGTGAPMTKIDSPKID